MITTFNKNMEYIQNNDIEVMANVVTNSLNLFDAECWTFLEKGIRWISMDTQKIKVDVTKNMELVPYVSNINSLDVQKVDDKIYINLKVQTEFGEVFTSANNNK